MQQEARSTHSLSSSEEPQTSLLSAIQVLKEDHVKLKDAFAESQQQLGIHKKMLAEQNELLKGQQQLISELQQEVTTYKHKAHYWEAQFERVKQREEALQDVLDETKAKLRKREQELFGRRSEKGKNTSKADNSQAAS